MDTLGDEFEWVVDDDGEKVYSKLKNLLFPKSGSHRKPAHPGPCEKFELFDEVMTSLPQLKVCSVHSLLRKGLIYHIELPWR